MAHFTTVVILPLGAPIDASAVSEMLAPYDEAVIVDPYEARCFCCGSVARAEALAAADARHDTEQYAERFQVTLLLEMGARGVDPSDTKQRSAIADELWTAFFGAHEAAFDAVFSRHPERDSPASSCADCRGSGVLVTVKNPKAKWGWWEVGGRWHGAFVKGAQIRDIGLGVNITRAGLLAVGEVFVPSAIITPDGEWREGDSEWGETARRIYEAHPDHVAVLLDLHI